MPSEPADFPPPPHVEYLTTRRDFLLRGGAGFGALALSLPAAGNRAFAEAADCRRARRWRRRSRTSPPKAKSVIFLFMEGGPSHIDMFDPKPKLNELAGKPLPAQLRARSSRRWARPSSPLLASQRKWKQHGQSGPVGLRLAAAHRRRAPTTCAVIRSCWADGINHSAGVCQMNTGSILGRPAVARARGSATAWAPRTRTCRRSSSCRTTTAHGRQRPAQLGRRLHAGRLPGHRAPGRRRADPEPQHARRASTDEQQRGKLDLLDRAQPPARRRRGREQTELDARIASYELAFRMQAEAPEAVDLAEETEATQGALRHGREGDRRRSAGMCLLARRLVERGVRFVQLYRGAGSKWDAHAEHREEPRRAVPGDGPAGRRPARRT